MARAGSQSDGNWASVQDVVVQRAPPIPAAITLEKVGRARTTMIVVPLSSPVHNGVWSHDSGQ
jgi:hypothetical protein